MAILLKKLIIDFSDSQFWDQVLCGIGWSCNSALYLLYFICNPQVNCHWFNHTHFQRTFQARVLTQPTPWRCPRTPPTTQPCSATAARTPAHSATFFSVFSSLRQGCAEVEEEEILWRKLLMQISVYLTLNFTKEKKNPLAHKCRANRKHRVHS